MKANTAVPLSSQSSSSGVTLVRRLEQQYGDRWGALLDSLFAAEESQRFALSNSFIPAKVKGTPLLTYQNVCLQGPCLAEGAETSRHASSGLLAQFWCHPSSVFPAAVATPPPKSSVLILGKPPAGRLLALSQLLFRNQCESPAQIPADRGRHRGTRSAEVSGVPSETLPVVIQTGPETVRAKGTPEWNAGLSWTVYGEGSDPREWQSGEVTSHRTTSLSKTSSLQSPPRQEWRNFGSFVEGLLHKSIQAGCFTVKTSSGDWSAIAEEAQRDSDATTPQGAEVSPAEGMPVAESGGQTELAGEKVVIECRQQSQRVKAQLEGLVEHHLPPDVRCKIRFTVPHHSHKAWWKTVPRDYDLVVIEAACSASTAAVKSSCQAKEKSVWPQKADNDLLVTLMQMLLDSFEALRSGGVLLYCSESLAVEETEDMVRTFTSSMDGVAKVLVEPADSSPSDCQSLLVTMKRFGVEQTGVGWRMLPDLSFQGPLFFSLIQKAF